jgi:hypothetical protein
MHSLSAVLSRRAQHCHRFDPVQIPDDIERKTRAGAANAALA